MAGRNFVGVNHQRHFFLIDLSRRLGVRNNWHRLGRIIETNFGRCRVFVSRSILAADVIRIRTQFGQNDRLTVGCFVLIGG